MSPDPNPFSDLPDDPEEAFLLLESYFSSEYTHAQRGAGEFESIGPHQVTYMTRVNAAAEALNLPAEFLEAHVPLVDQIDESAFQNYRSQVERYKTILLIKHSRRNKGYSVRFDAATKQKVRHLLEQIKRLVDKAELDDRKREALFARIRDFETELNRDRTKMAVVGALFVEACGFAGQGFDKLEPVRKMVESIGKAFGQAKSFEEANPSHTPLPAPPKQIEPPRAKALGRPKSNFDPVSNDQDDDMPF